MVNSLVGAFRGNASFRPRAEPRDKQRTEGDDAKWYCELDESGDGSSPNGRFLRHRSQTKQIGMNFKRLYQHQRSLPKSEGDHGFAVEGSPPKQSTFTTGSFSNIDSRDLA